MSKKEPKVKIVEDIKYENFCDAIAINYRGGIFALDFGQSITPPVKLLVRIWMDASSIKELFVFLQEQIKDYEKKYGKIK